MIQIDMQTSGAATPLDFASGDWLLVANALWASLIPVVLRYINKMDPAFGRVATIGLAEITKKLAVEASVAKKASKKK